ncbi:hypothetical protein Q8F55_008106 [Vanrija albida]|uniref:CTLH domain-containing protein n=1 Tax=Vanrija albida TaxID=181172 RepID=A0ABR3PVE6_9TREE
MLFPAAQNGNSTGNGSTNGASQAAESSSTSGPFNLPDAVLELIQPYRPSGTLMYEDDTDWAPDYDADVIMGSASHSDAVATSPRRQRFGKRMPIDREEIVRLMMQGLRDIGYQQTADVLAKESGFTLASQAALDFQAAVLGARWTEAIALLPDLGIASSPASGLASSQSSIRSGKVKAQGSASASDHAKFLIAQQKYLEYLEGGQQKKALAVLRNELATSATDSDALHDLSGYMMCLDRDDLYQRAKWDGAAGISRRQLLERLQEHISPNIMVPSRRLATLLDQARQTQQLSCPYHDDNDPVSLYTDHQCVSGTFPSVTTHILADHTDEVWRIEWSPNGNYLASASKDKTVVIWALKTQPGESRQYSVEPLHHLKGHRGDVDALAWSPDGETLVTASDKQIYIWQAKAGTPSPVTVETSQHTDTISAIQFMPNGTQFVVASLDCRVVFYNLNGTVARNWTIPNIQVIDFAITPDATRIIALTTFLGRVTVDNKIHPSISTRCLDPPPPTRADADIYSWMAHGLLIIRVADKEIIESNTEIQAASVTCLKLSSDSKHVLVNCSPDEVQLFSIEPTIQLVRKFAGHVQDRFVLRSCFGAPKDRFVLSGSEDGHVYVWQSNGAAPLEVLSGHSESVNAVAWNPILSRKLFASCSDDATIRIWQPPAKLDDGEESEAGDDADDADGLEL